MLTQEPDNPFQSPATSSYAVDVETQPQVDDLPVATIKAAIRWFLICGVSAAPSWLIAADETTAVYMGMATGVFIFIIGYTFLDVRTRKHPLRQRPDVKWTLAITYGTRIAISLLFPIGFFVDIICGIFAVAATGLVFENISVDTPTLHFTSTLVTTLIQGCLLNFVLAGYGLIVYAICRAYLESRSIHPS
ncbi:hypothetical protein C5Y96_18245 [Blastopirellula marina]|uniref:Uncharacterized protein n=1 Tax=Blastopirellula marina TaxID=124 RepID=A0A2S8F5Q4_9BACT|nr:MULTISPECIES: hypothetical protein [Pirellulaceae]PQO27477.1 hypothetical protein C5Y96_18245 [Blastopirellula marina]RCS48014.1 hypothetical protein DTL36_18270 [Bremerella cremea]